jgi:hypothetical protein
MCAYEIAKSEKIYQTNWNENNFSELLRYYVNESKLSLIKGITCITENKLFSIEGDLEKKFADRLYRIDFVYIKIWNSQKRFELHMEAKRLKESDSALKRAYISEGMDRFITGKYPFGIMLGYLLEGQTSATVKGINTLIIKDKRDSEILHLEHHDIVNPFYESYHSENRILRHIILDFTL